MGYSLKESVADVRWPEWLVRNIRMKAQEGKQILREETFEQTRGKISNATENRTHSSNPKYSEVSSAKLETAVSSWPLLSSKSVPTEIRLFTRKRILRYLWKEIKSLS